MGNYRNFVSRIRYRDHDIVPAGAIHRLCPRLLQFPRTQADHIVIQHLSRLPRCCGWSCSVSSAFKAGAARRLEVAIHTNGNGVRANHPLSPDTDFNGTFSLSGDRCQSLGNSSNYGMQSIDSIYYCIERSEIRATCRNACRVWANHSGSGSLHDGGRQHPASYP